LKQLIIGLTGPTGAGKSTWTAALKNLGCRIIDCDQLAREAVQNPDCIKNLQCAFGEDLISAEGLNRKELAKRAFQNAEHTKLLDQITHPVILALLEKELQSFSKEPTPAIIIDAPQLFESGLDSRCDLIAAVLAPKEIRIKRLQKRDGISREEALSRMSVQYSDDFFRKHCNFILDGNLLPEQVGGRASEFLQQVLEGNA
jgi:dephospho-CoA kinase